MIDYVETSRGNPNSLKQRICMIGGSGRSGTTILKTVFSHHPDCVLVPEYRFAIDPDGLIDFYRGFDAGWSPFLFDLRLRRLHALLTDIGRHRRVPRLMAYLSQKYNFERTVSRSLVPRYAGVAFERQCPTFMRRVDELMAALTDFCYSGQWNGSEFMDRRILHFAEPRSRAELAAHLGDFWRATIDDTCLYQGKSVFVEDNTWCILWFDTILELLPQARLVHVVREPRDIVASYTKMRWAPNEPVQAARWFKGIINQWFEVRTRLNSQNFIQIKLEDLVESPRETLERICDFWQVEWHDALLQTDLDRSHSGRWKSDFSPAQSLEVTRELEAEIAQLGYTR